MILSLYRGPAPILRCKRSTSRADFASTRELIPVCYRIKTVTWERRLDARGAGAVLKWGGSRCRTAKAHPATIVC